MSDPLMEVDAAHFNDILAPGRGRTDEVQVRELSPADRHLCEQLDNIVRDLEPKEVDVRGGKSASIQTRETTKVSLCQTDPKAYKNMGKSRVESGVGPGVSQGGCLDNTQHTPSTGASLLADQGMTPETTEQRLSRMSAWLNSPRISEARTRALSHDKRQATKKSNKQKREAIPRASWKLATTEEKFQYACHSAEYSGGLEFSLNLSAKHQGSLSKHTNPVRTITGILNVELNKEGLSGTPYALVLEYSKNDKLHVHGVVVVSSGSQAALKRALRAAGGVVSGKAGSRQLCLKKLHSGGRWAHYCLKDQTQTNQKLSHEARPFLNEAMTKAAREFSRSSQ
jgi:hypothetical protein